MLPYAYHFLLLNFFFEIIIVIMSMITVFDIRFFAVKRNNR
jgi:hypothetical protein